MASTVERLRPLWVGPDWVTCTPDTPGAQQLFIDPACTDNPPPVYRDLPDLFECVGLLVPDETNPQRQRVIGLPSGPEGVTDRGAFGVNFNPGNINIGAGGVNVNGPHAGVHYPHQQSLHYLKEGNFKAIFKKHIVQQVNKW
eukprot:EG_transcript_29450